MNYLKKKKESFKASLLYKFIPILSSAAKVSREKTQPKIKSKLSFDLLLGVIIINIIFLVPFIPSSRNLLISNVNVKNSSFVFNLLTNMEMNINYVVFFLYKYLEDHRHIKLEHVKEFNRQFRFSTKKNSLITT
uniref:Uncharacterized protein n=1 Tax=Rhizophagus irregularis (strain DAOM 181602 / DAOM 197198 / MUCL 43194) TaxID=747089 RepID=U9TCT4_RHIID